MKYKMAKDIRLEELHHTSHGPLEPVVEAAQRSLQKPRGLYHVSEVLDELLDPDMLSTYREVGDYKPENKCHGGTQ